MIDQFPKQSINRPMPTTILLISSLACLYIIVNLRLEKRVLWKFALIPYEIEIKNFWKLATAPFIHTSLLHLLLNIAFIWQRFSHVERRAGRFFLLFHIILFIILNGLLYCIIIIMFSYAGEFSLFYKPIMGFTSEIITMSVLEAHLSQQPYSSILGIIHIPTKYLPIAISLTYHIALDNASTLSHACALSIGYVYWMLFSKFLKKRWGNKQAPAPVKKEDVTPPWKLPGTVIATFDVLSPPGNSQGSTENSGYPRSN